MPAVIPAATRLPPRAAAAPEPEPDPGIWEGITSTFSATRADSVGYADEQRAGAYAGLMDTLLDMGYNRDRYVYGVSGTSMGVGSYQEFYRYDAIWKDVQAAKAKDPQKFLGIPASQALFDEAWKDKSNAYVAKQQRISEQAGTLPWLIGGFAGSMADPVNLATLPAGGPGKGPVMKFLGEMLVNGLVEAAEQPLVAAERSEQGRAPLTLQEAGLNTLFAAGGAGTIHVGGKVVGKAIDVAADPTRALFEKAVTTHWDRLPQGLRDRWASRATLRQGEQEVLLADLFEASIGKDNLSGAEADAVAVMRREGSLDAASPFVANGAGADMHPAMVGEAFDRLRQNLPGLPPAGSRTVVASDAEGRPFAKGDPIAAPSVYDAPGAQGRFMQKVRGAESGGSDAAKNPSSSATGRYQFIEGTWLHYYKKRYGAGGLTDRQILAKRSNGALQDQLMSDLTADNSAFLRTVGEGVNEGNLYLVHFAGQGGARKIFEAAPDTPIEQLLSPDAIAANSFLKGMTAADTIRWAHNKMGIAVAPGGAGSLRISDAMARNEADRAAIQDALDDAIARQQAADFERLNAARAQSGMALPAGDEAPVRIVSEDAPEIEAPRSEPPRRALPAEVQATLSPLRSMIETSKRNLNDFDAIAADIGANPEEVRAGLRALVEEGRITRDKRGYRRRAWVQQRGDGGVSARLDDDELLETIAKAGGLRDDEGHALGLRGISAREKRELLPQVQRRLREKRASGGSRDWQRMTRAHGPLLRHEGKSVDQIGELLWDEGWFRDRPTTAEVLDLIESRIQSGEKMYAPGRGPIREGDEFAAASAPEPAAQSRPPMNEVELAELARETQAMLAHVTGHSKWHGLREDDELLEEAAHIFNTGRPFNVTRDDALQIAMVEDIDRTLEMAYEEAGDDYGWREATPDELAELGFTDTPAATATGSGGRSAEPGGARAGAEELGSSGGPALADLSPEQRAPFLDPDGAAAKAQAESLIHDARAALGRPNAPLLEGEPGKVDPNIADRQRQEAELGAQAPMRATEEQDGTMGLGLFDHADQPEMKLELRGLLDSLDAEEAELKAIRDCL